MKTMARQLETDSRTRSALGIGLLLCLNTTIPAAAGVATIFSDGFESGDTQAWSQSVGLADCPAGTPVSGLRAGDLGPAPSGPYTRIGCVEFHNDQPFSRSHETAWGGIPLRQSLGITSVDELLLVGPGERRLASQFRVLSRWGGRVDDGTLPIRWLQVAVRPNLLGQDSVAYALRRYPGLTAAADPYAVTVQTQSNLSTIRTGVATFVFDGTDAAFLDSIAVDLDDDGMGPQTTIAAGGGGPTLSLGGNVLSPASGEVAIDPGSVRIVESGPVRAVISMSGHFVSGSGQTRCIDPDPPIDYDYEGIGFTVVMTLNRASRDIGLEFEIRNECSGAAGGDWNDESMVFERASWEVPFLFVPERSYWAGGGAVASSSLNFSGVTLVEQRRGGGMPWTRRARVALDGAEQENADFFVRPLVALSGPDVLIAAQMAWMRSREPQAMAIDNSTVSLRVISEPLIVGEGKGLWNHTKISIAPLALLPRRSILDGLETVRNLGTAELERGLLPRRPLAELNATQLFPSMGTNRPSTGLAAYLDVMNRLHDGTVGFGNQRERFKIYGSQVWPDTPFDDQWATSVLDDPYSYDPVNNYWNPLGAELFESLRSGEPRWAWDFALPQAWLQMHTAYLNIGEASHGNRNGSTVTSGGCGEGTWHRDGDDPNGNPCGVGSDDYTYNRSLHVAYAMRPTLGMLDRFRQAGTMVTNRYRVPWVDQADRDPFLESVDIARGVLQHFEHLANCAEFVSGAAGLACHDRLMEVLEELIADNTSAGLFCQGDLPNLTLCSTPQQFMTAAMNFGFLTRLYLNYGDAAGPLGLGLSRHARSYYDWGMATLGDGVTLDLFADWAAVMDCPLTNGGTQISSCTWIPIDGGHLLPHNRPHSVAMLLVGHAIDSSLGLCEVARTAFDDPDLTNNWYGMFVDGSGWYKGASQMMQLAVFGIGGTDVCSDPP